MTRERIEPLRAKIDATLLTHLPSTSSIAQPLIDAMRYSLQVGGKRIRPMLCLAACEAVGGDQALALTPGCAIEYAHTYSLIHDDLPAMDDDELRRGNPTCHVVYGDANAILAGNGLLTQALEMMATSAGLSPAIRLANLTELTRAIGCRGMLAGQCLDLGAEGQDLPIEQLEALHNAKTGALIAAAMVIGAQCGGADTQVQQRLFTFGQRLGLAFQVIDDILDVTADTETLASRRVRTWQRTRTPIPRSWGLPERGRRHRRSLLKQCQSWSHLDLTPQRCAC